MTARYLILSDAAQVEAAAALWGKTYTVISREQALNGHAAEIAEFPLVIWPTPDTVIREQHWAADLAAFSPEVKLTKTNLGEDIPFTVMQQMGWTPKEVIDWLYGKYDGFERIELVSANVDAGSLPDELGKQGGKDQRRIDRLTRAGLGSGQNTPVTSRTQINGGPPLGVPPFADSGVASSPAGAPGADGPPPLPDETGDSTALEAPPVDYHPGLAGRVYAEPQNAAGGLPEWPEPLDLTKSLYRGLPLPIDLIPAPLAPFVADSAKRLGTDLGPVWFGVLGALSGLANDYIRLQMKQRDSWSVHSAIWLFVLGGPSSGKSPAIEIGMNWVQKKDAEIVLENTRKLKDHEHALNIYADECAVARKNKAPRPNEPEPPTLREYWLNQGTREGAARLLQYSRKLCLYMDEISGFLNSMDRYTTGGKGSGDREFWLSCFNGGASKTTLAGKTVSIPNASITLCGGSTPSAMVSATSGKLQKDGLLARMLVCMVKDAKDMGEDVEPDAAAAATYDRILSNLIDMQHSATVKLSPDAGSVYLQFCDDLALRMKGEDNDQLAGTLGKWPGLWGRVCLIYWLTECAAYGQIPHDGDMIPKEIAEQVSKFFWWQYTHQQQFWHELMADKAGRKFSQQIARYILANEELTVLSFRDHVARPHHTAMDKLKPWEIKEAINTLVNAAWLTPIGLKANTYGVATSFDINPKLRGMFHQEREEEIERRSMIREELQAMRNREPGSD